MAIKVGFQSQECWFYLLEMLDEVLLLHSGAAPCVVSRQSSQGVTDADCGGRMFPQESRGAGCKQHMAIPSCARSSVPNSLASACAQQSSQQLRNTNDGSNYPIKMQGRQWKNNPGNLPCEFLRKAGPWCSLGKTGFKSHLCLPLKTQIFWSSVV